MSIFALIHGAGQSGWYWHLVEAELRALGHSTVAPDLPTDESATLTDYADVVLDAIGSTEQDVVVVAQSFGGFTAPLVATRLPAAALVFVAGMVPRSGETPGEWWANTDYAEAAQEQAAQDGGLTGASDPYVCYYHDVPRHLADQELSMEREHPSTAANDQPWPGSVFPTTRTRFLLCTQDRLFPAPFMRRLARERLSLVADEIESGHCPALSHPRELAVRLASYEASVVPQTGQ
ncbi:MAG TPA: alpha/beta hydrolase [Propionibacteriaceae bacterium]|jgi:pimeloyl-ACP methyl ester carboxylesterase